MTKIKDKLKEKTNKPVHNGNKKAVDKRKLNRDFRKANKTVKKIPVLSHPEYFLLGKDDAWIMGTYLVDKKLDTVNITPLFKSDSSIDTSSYLGTHTLPLTYFNFRNLAVRKDLITTKKDIYKKLKSLNFQFPSQYISWLNTIHPCTSKLSKQSFDERQSGISNSSLDWVVISNDAMSDDLDYTVKSRHDARDKWTKLIVGKSNLNSIPKKGEHSSVLITDPLIITHRRGSFNDSYVNWLGWGFTTSPSYKYSFVAPSSSIKIPIYDSNLDLKCDLLVRIGIDEIVNSDLPSSLIKSLDYICSSDESKESFKKSCFEKVVNNKYWVNFGPIAGDEAKDYLKSLKEEEELKNKSSNPLKKRSRMNDLINAEKNASKKAFDSYLSSSSTSSLGFKGIPITSDLLNDNLKKSGFSKNYFSNKKDNSFNKKSLSKDVTSKPSSTGRSDPYTSGDDWGFEI